METQACASRRWAVSSPDARVSAAEPTLKFRYLGWDAAVRCPQDTSRRRLALGDRQRPRLGDVTLELDTIARGHGQKIGSTPDHIVLELADLAIGIDQLPHHLDDAQPALVIDLAHDDA